jgi:uncharacterized protein (TIGR02246 family)
MKRLMLALFLVPSLGLAAEKTSAPSDDPMAGWVPPKVTNAAKSKQEIQAVFRAMDAAGRTGDLDAAVALIDFPVTMITDNSKGEGMGEAWDREKWMEVMKPFYAKPMKDMKITHKPDVFLLSDSLATVDDVATMTKGGKSVVSRSSTLLVRRDGQWRVKTMAEGGWGDMMAAKPQGTASSTSQPASGGTGSSAAEPPSQSTGSSASEPQGSQPTGTGAHQEPSDRTTK